VLESPFHDQSIRARTLPISDRPVQGKRYFRFSTISHEHAVPYFFDGVLTKLSAGRLCNVQKFTALAAAPHTMGREEKLPAAQTRATSTGHFWPIKTAVIDMAAASPLPAKSLWYENAHKSREFGGYFKWQILKRHF
jgi:hypothetical protein